MYRNSSLIICFFFLLFLGRAYAQIPQNIQIYGELGATDVRQACPAQFAGNIGYGTFIGQSNDISPDTIYLCYGDSMQILNTGSNLSGDPKPATTPGIGYAFYKCKPSVSGPSLNAILNDACRITMPTPTNGIWVATEPGDPSGNIWFYNKGYVQDFFNSGKPKLVWFAPITLDDFANKGFEIDGSGIAGACVHVNTVNSFAMVYLNEIQISNISSNASIPIAGSFSVFGGLPEYEVGNNYKSIKIELVSNPAIKGSLTGGPFKHGDKVNFTVPQAGDYRITVVDNKNGSSSRIVKFPANDVGIEILCADVLPDSTMCIQFTVSNFTDIASFQYSINWDPLLFQFQSINIPMPTNLPDLSSGLFNTATAASGYMALIWLEGSANGVTLLDGTLIFEMCFKAIGPPMSSGQFIINDIPVPIEFTNGSGEVLTYDLPPCTATIIKPTGLSMYYTSCSSNLAPLNGGINFSIYGGTGPYDWSFTASNPPSGSGSGLTEGQNFSLSNLGPGTYIFTVTDAVGTTITKTIQVVSAAPLQAQQIITDPTCYGSTNGMIVIDTITGGLLPYLVSWSTGEKESWFVGDPDPSISGLTNGTYMITITDGLGCQKIYTNDLIASPVTVLNGVITNASCSGKSDGQISVIASGGKKINGNQYTYIWKGEAPVTAISTTKINLPADTFFLKIIDANGCELDTFFIVGDIKDLEINSIGTKPNCNGDINGSLVATGVTSGGPASTPYSFTWSPNAPAAINTATNSTLNPLGAGTYSVTMTDATGCTLDSTFTLTEPDTMKSFVLFSAKDTCFEGTGRLTIGIFGGTVDPNAINNGWYWGIKWSNDSIGQTITNLGAGFYQATVTDFNGCTNDFNFEVRTAGSIDSVSFVKKDLACPFDVDGTLTATAHFKAGITITSFAWSANAPAPVNTASSSSLTNLQAGWYVITVTSSDGCQSIDSIQLLAPDSIQIFPTVLAPTCIQSHNGSINLILSGGKLPFTFKWSNGKATQNITGLDPGSYSVSITDGNLCPPQIYTFFVPTPPFINFAISGINSPSCESKCDGKATINLPGNPVNGPFTIEWLPSGSFLGQIDMGVFSSTADSLCAGDISFIITDANGCMETDKIPITPAVQIDINDNSLSLSPVSCFGGSDGSADFVPIGGQGPYTYAWDKLSDMTPNVNGLSAGEYIVTITDATGCGGIDTISISEPDSLVAVIDLNDSKNISCGGYDDGQITVQYTGGNAGQAIYTWTNNISSTNSASNLSAGDYIITVEDAKGCMDTVMVTLTEPTPVTANIPTPPSPQCFGFQTFVSVSQAFGGTGGNYSFTVDKSPPQPITTTIPVLAGTHNVQVFDGNGCAFDTTIIITEPGEITVFAGQDTVVNLGDSIQLFPVSNSLFPINKWEWSPPTGLSCSLCENPYAQPFKDQLYELTVTDANGCTATDALLIEVDKTRKVFIPNGFSPDDDGVNDIFSVFSGPGVRKINSMQIFDRWGAEIFFKADLPANGFGTEGWDGRYKNQKVNMGVYVFLIEVEFEDDVKLLYRGDITVKR